MTTAATTGRTDGTARPHRLDQLVDATPASRDRYVDFLRAVSILVVVLWHWVLSVTHWSPDGRLVMPNPLDHIPGGWAATWVLQVIPVFFLIGGYSNGVGLAAARRRGESTATFLAGRMQRLLPPVGAFLAVWLVGDGIARLVVPDYRGVTHWGMVVFVPLWFIAVYGGIVLLSPITERWHRRSPMLTLAAMAGTAALVDLVRFGGGLDRVGLLNGVVVFAFVHQLGYLYADGSIARWSRRTHAAIAGAGLVALVALTTFGPYPHSMVATPGATVSNLNPPTLAIAALATFQFGLLLLIRPAATRWLAGRGPWRCVIAVNSVLMTVFAWHMTAWVLALAALDALGVTPGTTADAGWWAARPIWLLIPALALVPLVAVFSRFERVRPRAAPVSR